MENLFLVFAIEERVVKCIASYAVYSVKPFIRYFTKYCLLCFLLFLCHNYEVQVQKKKQSLVYRECVRQKPKISAISSVKAYFFKKGYANLQIPKSTGLCCLCWGGVTVQGLTSCVQLLHSYSFSTKIMLNKLKAHQLVTGKLIL